MGFDKDQPGPVVNVHKRTTKVNIWMIIGVVIFFIAGGVMIWVFSNQAPGTGP